MVDSFTKTFINDIFHNNIKSYHRHPRGLVVTKRRIKKSLSFNNLNEVYKKKKIVFDKEYPSTPTIEECFNKPCIDFFGDKLDDDERCNADLKDEIKVLKTICNSLLKRNE